jgi:tetratricopeptide (TPR) repeat protein
MTLLDNGPPGPHTSGMRELLAQLRDDLIERRIESGLARVNANRALVCNLDICRPEAAPLVGYLAQWEDIGGFGGEFIAGLIELFPKESRLDLPLIGYIHLRMAEGFVAMAEENFDDAARHFEFVGRLDEDIGDTEVIAIANFWIARCLRQQGRYDDALAYTEKARRLALDAGYEKIGAVFQVLESWLVFQKGRLREAARILEQAEAVLNGTDDYVARGNIQSAYGRIAQREGKYARALACFDRAIAEYKKRDAQHKNLARTLVNTAFVKRLIAIRLQKKVDREARRRQAEPGLARPAGQPGSDRARIAELRDAAFAELAEAFAIVSHRHNHRIMGAVHINRALLHLDSGELDQAAAEAAEAFRLAREKADFILMARARILAAMVENTKFEEQIEETDDPNRHAQLADEFARDAVEYAQHTQNARLLARAYICQGMVLSNSFFDNVEAARRCSDSALELIGAEGHEYIWEELQELRARAVDKSHIETVLQEWSQGLVRGKTFQQVSEEFAALVIPKVWEREGRKVARVAAKLSISPKKVRRVLQAAGLLGKSESV